MEAKVRSYEKGRHYNSSLGTRLPGKEVRHCSAILTHKLVTILYSCVEILQPCGRMLHMIKKVKLFSIFLRPFFKT